MTGILLFSSLTGCNLQDFDTTESDVRVLYLVTSLDDVYRKKLSNAIVRAASENGVDLDMYETHGNPDTEIKYITSARDKGYNVIICRPGDNSSAPLINRSSNDLPIIYVNNQPAEEHLESDKYIFVGSNEQDAGKYQAEYVISRLGKGAMNVVILEGEKGHSATEGRTYAVKATLKNNGINANYIYVDYADWSYDIAKQKFSKFANSDQDVDAVFCNNDSMALGVIEAMKEKGFDCSKIPVVGVDATPEACQSIKDGDMAFTVFQNANKQGYKAIEAAVEFANENTIAGIEGATSDRKYIWVDFEAVTQDNVYKYENALK